MVRCRLDVFRLRLRFGEATVRGHGEEREEKKEEKNDDRSIDDVIPLTVPSHSGTSVVPFGESRSEGQSSRAGNGVTGPGKASLFSPKAKKETDTRTVVCRVSRW